MALTYALNTARQSSAGNPITRSVTASRDSAVLCVLLNVIGSSLRAGGALTWGEYTLQTPAQSPQRAAASPEASAELWYLTDVPRDGQARTLTIPNTGALTIKYTIVEGISPNGARFSASNGNNNTAVNPSCGGVFMDSRFGQNHILFGVVVSGAQTWTGSLGAGTNIATTDDGSTGGSEAYTVSAVGSSTTVNFTWIFGTSEDFGGVAASFQELPPKAFNNYMTPSSVGQAGIISVGERVR